MGGSVSMTVTVWLPVAMLPQASVALKVRVATNVFPQVAFVVVLTIVTGTVTPSQRSVAVGVLKDQGLPHWTTKFVSAPRTGGWVSMTVATWLHLEVLLQRSTASHMRVAV